MSSHYDASTPWRRASVLSPEMERAQSKLEQSQRTFSQTQQELHQAMRVRASTPMSAMESSAKDHEIAGLQKRLHDQEGQIENLRLTIERQKMTIKTQSETISNPKQHFPTPPNIPFRGNQYGQGNLALPPPPAPIFADPIPKNTPSRPGSIRPSGPPPHQRQDSSPFNAPRGPQPMRQQPIRQPQGPQVQPTPVRPTRNVTEFGSPEALLHGFGRMSLSNTPRGSAQGSDPTPASSTTKHTRNIPSNGAQSPALQPFSFFNPSNGMALIRPTSTAPTAPTAMVKKFGELVHMAEMYAYSHVNTPSTHKDNAIPQEIKDRLMSASSTTTAFQFMQTPYTRYMLVTKLILQYIFRVVLKHDSFAGLDKEADRTIENCKDQMYQSTPAQIKYQLLATMSTQIAKMQSDPRFEGFFHSVARSRGNELWGVLKPMMHQKTSRDWDDLYDLMVTAHELAKAMYSGSEEYKFDFPTVGQQFRQNSMEPREPYQTIHTHDELESLGATVRLGYTPLITARTSTPDGYVNSQQILKAFVLLKNER